MRLTAPAWGPALVFAASLLSACANNSGGSTENKVAMVPISYNEIAGWADDKHFEAVVAFRHSCLKLVAAGDSKVVTDGGEKIVSAAEWKRICDSAAAVPAGDGRAARRFFERFLLVTQSRCTMATGVLAGANMPLQPSDS